MTLTFRPPVRGREHPLRHRVHFTRRFRGLHHETLEQRRLLASFSPHDVVGLISSLNTANSNGEADTIELGGMTFLLSSIDNEVDGNNGLPVILPDGGHSLTIANGTLERAAGSLSFRILHVGLGAQLTLEAVSILGGEANGEELAGAGGGVLNHGQTVFHDSLVSANTAATGGAVSNRGTIQIENSAVSGNTATGAGSVGAGIFNSAGAEATIGDSTISGNTAVESGIWGEGDWTSGGGISNSGALELTNTVVSDNRADAGGGIMNYGVATLTDATLSDNQGGGLRNHETIALVRSVISGNYTYFGEGAGISNYGRASITGSTVSRNWTYVARGGGIVNWGEMTVAGSIVSGNGTYFGSGGGIFNGGDLTVTETSINDNGAYSGQGGGIYNGATATLTRSTISGNGAAYGDGGGIANGGEMTVVGSTVSANGTMRGHGLTGFGGGIFNGGVLSLTGSTVTKNAAGSYDYPHSGGGIYNQGTATLNSTIVAGNLSPADQDLDGAGDLSAVFSLIGELGTAVVQDMGQNLIGGGAYPAIDAGLGPLQDNGGPTHTHALLFESPALDAGQAFGTNDDSDQRGLARTVEIAGVNDPSIGDGTDIGAYELQSLTRLVVTTDDDELDVEFDPDDLSLREAIAVANASDGPYRIEFNLTNVSAAPPTIALTLGELSITDSLLLVGGGRPHSLTIEAADASRVFNVDDATETNIHVEMRGLTLRGGSAESGGAILNREDLLIASALITDNTAVQQGGGIDNQGAVTLRRSTVSGNTVLDPLGNGGGILNDYTGTLDLQDCTIGGKEAGNEARYGGGLLNRGIVTVTKSTISGNIAFNGGGAINRGTLTLVSSTISGNSAQLVGGGLINRGTAKLTGSTVSSNAADNAGGGILNNYLTPGETDGGKLTLVSSIVSGNRAGNRDPDVRALANVYVQISMIGDSGGSDKVYDWGLNIIGGGAVPVVDAMLGPLQNNGGPTETHALLTGSPAIDAGRTYGQRTDQRGQPRTVDTPDVGDSAAYDKTDMGAFEFQVLPTADAGGPYAIDEGESLTLDPTASSDPLGRTLIYFWDLDDDGVHERLSTGPLTLSWLELQGLDLPAVEDGEMEIGLRVVTRPDGAFSDASALVIVRHVVAPTVVEMVRNDGRGLYHRLDSLSFRFSESVSPSIGPDDVSLAHASAGASVDTSTAALEWFEATNTAVWMLGATQLEPGEYVVTLAASGVEDTAGNRLDGNADGVAGGDFQRSIIVTWQGDINLDLTVGFDDFLKFATHFGQVGDWEDGDFTGDQRVDFNDFLALAANFGRSLPAAPEPALATIESVKLEDYDALFADLDEFGALIPLLPLTLIQ